MAVLCLSGCGEVSRLDLAVRPRQDDFAEVVQPALLAAGCGRSLACHGGVGGGELTIKKETDPDSIQESYLSTVGFVKLDDVSGSKLLYYVEEGDERAIHRPTDCWTADDCAYRKIAAWVEWGGVSEVRPQEVDCVVEDDLPCR